MEKLVSASVSETIESQTRVTDKYKAEVEFLIVKLDGAEKKLTAFKDVAKKTKEQYWPESKGTFYLEKYDKTLLQYEMDFSNKNRKWKENTRKWMPNPTATQETELLSHAEDLKKDRALIEEYTEQRRSAYDVYNSQELKARKQKFNVERIKDEIEFKEPYSVKNLEKELGTIQLKSIILKKLSRRYKEQCIKKDKEENEPKPAKKLPKCKPTNSISGALGSVGDDIDKKCKISAGD